MGFLVYRMKICFGFKNNFFFFFFFFFKHKLHAGQILNFGQYLPKHPETPVIDRNNSKFFQSGIGWVTIPVCLSAWYFLAVPAGMELN